MLYSLSGTSNATTLTVTLPFNAKDQVNAPVSVGIDNGTGQYSYVRTRAGSNILDAFRTITTITWTGSGNKNITFNFTYEIE